MTRGTAATLAAKQATSTIPIVVLTQAISSVKVSLPVWRDQAVTLRGLRALIRILARSDYNFSGRHFPQSLAWRFFIMAVQAEIRTN